MLPLERLKHTEPHPSEPEVGVDLDENYRKKRTLENRYLQDREAMKRGDFTGIAGIPTQDMAMWESMGPIVDRSEEYLGTCDRVIYRARKLLLEAVKRHRDTGELSFAGPDIDYSSIRAVSYAYPRESDWREVDPYELSEAAE